MTYDRPVVVVSGHTMALGAVRALGEAGVPVHVLHHDERDFAHTSRYVVGEQLVPSPQDEERAFLEALLRYADRAPGAMLLPASDEATAAVSRHAARLSERYVVACPDWTVVRRFIEKAITYDLAARAGVGTPATEAPATLQEAYAAAARLGFPLLVKPSQSHLFYEKFKRKLVVVANDRALAARFEEARAAGVDVVLQELIPGPDTEVVNYNAYVWDGRPLAEFTARQLRKAPPRFGSPRVVLSERVDGVVEPGRATLRALGFQGFACSEFKRDPRDGRYKILDVNGRPNLSGLLAVRCGINFPLLQYRHLLYGEAPRPRRFTEGLYWTDVLRDVGYGLRFLLTEHHAPWTHLAPYLAPGCDAIYDRDDMRPFYTRTRQLTGTWLRRARPARAAMPPSAAGTRAVAAPGFAAFAAAPRRASPRRTPVPESCSAVTPAVRDPRSPSVATPGSRPR